MKQKLNKMISCAYEGVFDKLPLGITITDLKLKPLYQNNIVDAWIALPANKNTLWIDKINHYADTKDYISELEHKKIEQKVVHDADVYEYTCEFQSKHRSFQFKFSFSPIKDEDGSIIGVLEHVENTSESLELSLALIQSKRFENVGRLASGIAHDFNNILQVIIGHTEIMQSIAAGNEKLKRSLEVLMVSGQKASALTRQLLIFSRKQESEYKVFELKHTLTNILKIISRMVGEDVKINVESSKNTWPICADESQIEQIFLNLAVNGRDAMPIGGTLDIRLCDCLLSEMDCSKLNLSKAGKYVMIRFSDTGTGIESDKLECIFDPFFTTKTGGKGTGLGLSTVYSIVRQHQGIITVHSELNVGTVFEIYLPATEANGERQEKQIEDKAPTHETSHRVLVVEDDVMVSELASQVLSLHGYMVDTAQTIEEAVNKTLATSYDLYLVDIVLPDGSGVDLIEYIHEKDPNAAFLLSSGYTEDKPQIKRALDKGHDFLHKPYTISTLISTCSQILSKKKNLS